MSVKDEILAVIADNSAKQQEIKTEVDSVKQLLQSRNDANDLLTAEVARLQGIIDSGGNVSTEDLQEIKDALAADKQGLEDIDAILDETLGNTESAPE